MPGTIAEPDSALRPKPGRKEAEESGAEESEATSAPVSGPTVKTTPSTAATPDESAAASTDEASADTSSSDTSSSARKSDDQREANVGSLIATEGGNPPSASKGDGASDDGDEPPSGRPTKALLAAAGIGGALLIAIPFLAAGTNDKDDSEPTAMARQTSAHEGIWSVLRRTTTANRVFADPDDLITAVRRGLRQLQYRYDVLDGCFAGTGLRKTS
ncbi:hypothetical protein ACWC5C_20920 [Streptomyces sp. NPDC001700]